MREGSSAVRRFAGRGTLAGGGLTLAAFGTLAVLALRWVPTEFQAGWLMVLGVVLALWGFGLGAAGHPADPLDNRTLALASGRADGLSVASMLAAHASLPALLAAIPYLCFIGVAAVSGEHWLAVAVPVIAWLQWVMWWRLGTRTGRRLSERHTARDGRAVVVYGVLLFGVTVIYGFWLFPWQDAVSTHGPALAHAVAWVPVLNVFLISYGVAPLAILSTNGALLVVLWAIELWLGARAARTALFKPQFGGRTRLGIFGSVRGSATGNIAARTWLSWLRDPRYQVLLGTVIVLPPLLLLPVWIGGAPTEILRLVALPLFMMCLGWALHNDTAYDFTALWVHVSVGLSGRADRAGRALPTLLTGVVLALLGWGLIAAGTGDQLSALVVFATSIAVLGTTVGGSSIMSALAPYPVARPGDSPFSQPVRSWGSAAATQPLALLVEVAACIPTGLLGWQAIEQRDWSLAWGSLAAGAATALIALPLGILLGGLCFDRRRAALLTFAQSY